MASGYPALGSCRLQLAPVSIMMHASHGINKRASRFSTGEPGYGADRVHTKEQSGTRFVPQKQGTGFSCSLAKLVMRAGHCCELVHVLSGARSGEERGIVTSCADQTVVGLEKRRLSLSHHPRPIGRDFSWIPIIASGPVSYHRPCQACQSPSASLTHKHQGVKRGAASQCCHTPTALGYPLMGILLTRSITPKEAK